MNDTALRKIVFNPMFKDDDYVFAAHFRNKTWTAPPSTVVKLTRMANKSKTGLAVNTSPFTENSAETLTVKAFRDVIEKETFNTVMVLEKPIKVGEGTVDICFIAFILKQTLSTKDEVMVIYYYDPKVDKEEDVSAFLSAMVEEMEGKAITVPV